MGSDADWFRPRYELAKIDSLFLVMWMMPASRGLPRVLSIPAWRDGHYVSLAELLRVLGRLVSGLSWRVSIVEVAPDATAEELEAVSPSDTLDTSQLLHLSTPDVQIIDGMVSGFDAARLHAPVLVLRAVDSTSWDIEYENDEVTAVLRASYPEAKSLSL